MRLSLLRVLASILAIAIAADPLKSDNSIGNEIYEIRIFETAPPGTKATLNEAFDQVMREQKNCFAQLETAWDTDWIEFDSALLMFITTSDVPITARTTQQAVLHLMCASNQMRSIHFSIHVTRRNRHPPKFVADSLEFYAPATLQPGSELGVLQVIDNDPIIYNSQVQLNILPSAMKIGAVSGSGASRVPSLGVKSPAANEMENHWLVLKNGSLVVNTPMTDLQLYRPYVIRVLAVDFGSPQLFSICNVTIVPVSVSQPLKVRVNVANTEYQVFEWDAPAFGIPEKYRITIRRHGTTLHTQEVEANQNIVMSRMRFPSGADYTVTITAVDVDGSSPSEPYPFILIHTELSCEGECSPGGGTPLCYYGRFHKIEQYRDESGPHCLCYDGFSSPQCDIIESCPGERILEPYGGVDWPFTPVNQSSSILCPYNANDEVVTRNCAWDTRLQMARWQNISNNDVCKRQSSILVHLGVLANYAQRADQTASGLRAVQRFLATVLRMPAFRPHVTSAHFDAKIAEHIAQVLDTMTAVNLSAIAGNTSDVRADIIDYMLEFTRRIPVPFHLQSSGSGFQIRTWHWLGSSSLKNDLSDSSVPIGDEFPVQFGRRCYIHLPTGRRQRGGALIINGDSQSAQVVRVACLRPTTLLPLLEGRSPVMFVTADTDDGEASSLQRGDDIKKRMIDEDRSVELQRGKITVVKISDSTHQPTIMRQKIADGAIVRIALRPESLASAHGALLGYGDAGMNYTCAIYDQSKYGWSITGITVLSRNFEDGFVLCESTHLGVFALLPESMFEAKNVSLWQILVTILPIASASFAALCTIFLLFIAVLQRPQCPDPALILFLFTFLALHLLHLLLLIAPHTIDDAKLAANDRTAYLCLQYSLISIAALLMLLAAATHARIVDLETGVRRVVSLCCRLVSSVILGIAIPILMCITTWLYNGNIYKNLTSSDPYFLAFNWTFAISFALPLSIFVGTTTGYACYSYYYAQLTLKTPVIVLSTSSSPYSAAVADSGRQRLIRDLAYSSLFMPVILALIFANTITFLHVNEPLRNLLLAAFHLALSAVVFIFTGLLYRIELKFPRYTHGNHIGEARRLFVNGTNGSAFFLGSDASKSNGNARANGTTPLIFNGDESDSTATNIPSLQTVFQSDMSADVNERPSSNGILMPPNNNNNSGGNSVYEGRKCNYFTYDPSHGRCNGNYVTQLGVPTALAGHEEDDDDSGRLTLSSPAPSSLQNAMEILRIRDVSADVDRSPSSDLGSATPYNRIECNAVSYRGEYAGIKRSSHCSAERLDPGKAYIERYGSMHYDRILSPTLPIRKKNSYTSELTPPAADSNFSNDETNRTYRTVALQKQHQMVQNVSAPAQATKMSLLKINFLYGKEMEALTPSQVTIESGSDLAHHQSIIESNKLTASSSPSSPNDSSSLLNKCPLIKTALDEVNLEFDSESAGHPVVSVV